MKTLSDRHQTAGNPQPVRQHFQGGILILDRLSKIAGIVATCLIALDLVLRDGGVAVSSSWLTTAFLHMNALQLAAVASVAIVAARLFPPVHRRICVRQRAQRFYKDWQKFKQLLADYRDIKPDALQEQYARLSKRLRRHYSYFAPTMISIERSFPHSNYAEAAVNNLGTCFRASQLAECHSRVRKAWPAGVDCFDHMFLDLIEHGASVPLSPKAGA